MEEERKVPSRRKGKKTTAFPEGQKEHSPVDALETSDLHDG